MKRFYHSELEAFKTNIILMGERCIELVRLSIQALEERDVEIAQEIIEGDDEIDDLEVQISTDVIRYISLRAPVATELRLLMIGMRLANDLERVGDEACTIAKRTIALAEHQSQLPLGQLREMAIISIQMLRDSLDSFLNEDVEIALSVPQMDDTVDRINKDNYTFLKERMKTNPEDVEACFNLVFVSKSLERIADHATNLAEDVRFYCGGRDIQRESTEKQGA